MLLPMGLPREVSVIAWGVSLERLELINVDAQHTVQHVMLVCTCMIAALRRCMCTALSGAVSRFKS